MEEQFIKIDYSNFDKYFSFFERSLTRIQKDMLIDKVIKQKKEIYVFAIGNIYVASVTITFKENTLFLSNLFVIDEYRGKGYAKKVLNYIFSYASLNNYDSVSCNVRSNNDIALNMYDEIGFKVNNSNHDQNGTYYTIYKNIDKNNRRK